MIALLIVAVVFFWEGQHSYGIAAYDDIYDKLKLYRTSGDTLATLRQLFALHNEHRIATTRALMVADELWDGGREAIPIIVSNALQCLGALLCSFAVLRRFSGQLPAPSEALFIGGVITLMFVNPNLLETLDLPFLVEHPIMGFLVVLTAWQIGANVDGPRSARTSWFLVARFVALALVASVTLGNAPVLMVTAFAAAVLFRWGLRITFVLGALTAFHAVLTIATTPSVGATAKDVWAILDFTVVYLGSPFLRIMAWPAVAVTWATPLLLARIAGTIVLALPCAFAFVQACAPRRGRSLAAFGFVLCTAVVVTALAAGYARSQFGVEAASDKKYASFAALGWVGSLALLIAMARELPRLARPAADALVLASYLVALPLSVAALSREEGIWGDFMNRNWLAATAVYTGVGDRNALQAIYPEPPLLLEYATDIETRGRGIFARYPFRMGDPLSAVISRAVEVPCRSEVEDAAIVPNGELAYPLRASGIPVKVHGWTWMTPLREPADAVVAVDSADHLAGLAHAVSVSPRAALWLGQSSTQQLEWVGYAVSDAIGDLRYIALSRDGRAYCPLGKQGDVR